VRIFTIAFPDVPLQGSIESISASAFRAENRQGLTFKVKVLIAKPFPVHLRPGMSCRSEIVVHSKSDALVVPMEAVLYDDEDKSAAPIPYVFVTEAGKAAKRVVVPGISNDSHMEILGNLT